MSHSKYNQFLMKFFRINIQCYHSKIFNYIIFINELIGSFSNAPFGGYKTSGWGRQLGSYGLEAYMNVKGVHHNYGELAPKL